MSAKRLQIEFEPMPHQTETYYGKEVATILKRRTALTTQPPQLCVDSGLDVSI